MAIKGDLSNLEHLDGVKIPKISDIVSDKIIHDIQSLQEQQYAERRLKLQQEQDAKNKKPGKEAPKAKEAPKKEAKDVKVEVKADPIEHLEMASVDTRNEGMLIPEGLVHPLRLQLSIKTLENFDSVFLEDLADAIDARSPAPDKDRVMASYWLELAFSTPLLPRQQAYQHEGSAAVPYRGSEAGEREAQSRLQRGAGLPLGAEQGAAPGVLQGLSPEGLQELSRQEVQASGG